MIPACIAQTVKHVDGSVMVRGCFSSSGTGDLTRIHGILKMEGYRDILKNNANPSGLCLIRNSSKWGLLQNASWGLLQNAWKNLTMTVLEKLDLRMPRLCEVVIKRNGGFFNVMQFSSHYLLTNIMYFCSNRNFYY